MKELQAIVRALAAPISAPSVLATLVTVEGSSYRRPGARLLLTFDGKRIGSISGGCLEEDVLARARQVATTGQAEAIVYDTTSENDLVWGIGLGCHGVVRVLIERLPPKPAWAVRLAENFTARQSTEIAVIHREMDGMKLGTRLASEVAVISVSERTGGGSLMLATAICAEATTYFQTISPPTRLCIFGAGDDALPLVRLGKELGWLVTIADPRPAFATIERFPDADAIVVGSAEQLGERVAPDRDSLAVIMTHHYVHDVPLVRTLLPRSLAYLGLLGPRKRAEKILANLAADGFAFTREQRARLHAPVGLDLGADAPEQVALAIVAEIQAVLAGRKARPLRERSGPIHE